MRTKDGKQIIDCDRPGMHCASCMFRVTWMSSKYLHEGDPDYCQNPNVVAIVGVDPAKTE